MVGESKYIEGPETPSPCVGGYRRALLEAVLICLACAGIALLVNAVRADSLPWIQEQAYQILVPCPEVIGEVEEWKPGDPALSDSRALWLDARPQKAYEASHRPSARNLPYDYLEPVPDKALQEVFASGASRIIVYGDGGNPDPGEHLAKELAGRGVMNVGWVPGGLPALDGSGDASGGRP